jgi:hypothetical protein
MKPESLAMPGDHGFRFDRDQAERRLGQRKSQVQRKPVRCAQALTPGL